MGRFLSAAKEMLGDELIEIFGSFFAMLFALGFIIFWLVKIVWGFSMKLNHPAKDHG